MAQLVVKYGVKTEGASSIEQSPFVIGRGPSAALRLDNPLVSREHCAIHHSDGQFVIQDLKSGSGTLVNGRALTAPHMLNDGDKIEIGKHTLTFEKGFGDTPTSGGGGSDASASAFWTTGLSGDAAAPAAPQMTEAPAPSAAPMSSGAGAFDRTMLASPEEMKKLREQLNVSQQPHLSVFDGGKKHSISLGSRPVRFGYSDGADYRIPRSRWFVKLGFVVEHAGGGNYQVRAESSWAKVFVGGKRTKGAALLRSGDQIEIDGLKVRFSLGEVS